MYILSCRRWHDFYSLVTTGILAQAVGSTAWFCWVQQASTPSVIRKERPRRSLSTYSVQSTIWITSLSHCIQESVPKQAEWWHFRSEREQWGSFIVHWQNLCRKVSSECEEKRGWDSYLVGLWRLDQWITSECESKRLFTWALGRCRVLLKKSHCIVHQFFCVV